MLRFLLLTAAVTSITHLPQSAQSFSLTPTNSPYRTSTHLHASTSTTTTDATSTSTEEPVDYQPPEDAIIQIKPKAMARLIELKQKRDADTKNPIDDPSSPLILRMGVRNGGCSGLSYVMDFSTSDEIEEEDEIDNYEKEGIQCVVDAKSLLYLYGLELDYSDDLIGGGFKFFNPNAEESCGCGSSFGV
jgi:iron-sulfur cluster assembly accessory protein|eukprot:g642.t1 g642   contig10:447159-447725(-)